MYLIKSSNSKPIVVHKAQNNKDALEKAENLIGKELENPKIKFYDEKKCPDQDLNKNGAKK
jgi:hypothetical protein